MDGLICTPVQLYSGLTVQRFTCTATQLYSNSTVQRFNCTVAQLYSDSTVQRFNCTAVQLYSGSPVQRFNCTVVHLYSGSTVQRFDCHLTVGLLVQVSTVCTSEFSLIHHNLFSITMADLRIWWIYQTIISSCIFHWYWEIVANKRFVEQSGSGLIVIQSTCVVDTVF